MAGPDELTSVDLSGGASTLANQARATDAYGRAVKAAFSTPAGNAQGSSLLEKYRQWEASRQQELNRADAISAVKASLAEVTRQLEALKGARPSPSETEAVKRKAAKKAAKKLRKARKAIALATPEAVETRARRQATKAMSSLRTSGGDDLDAMARGFRVYLENGGKAALPAFKRLVARGN